MGIGIEPGSANIGNKLDYVGVPYSSGDDSVLAYLRTGYFHVHGQPLVYPDHADDVELLSGSGAWDVSGAKVEIIPADTLTESAFDLHWINISDINSVATIQIDIFSGASGEEVLIGATRATRATNQDRNGPSRIQIAQQASGTRISCRLSDSTTGTVTANVSLEGHYYKS